MSLPWKRSGAGALIDLETAVQLIQVTRATRAPQLRTPRLQEVIEALRRANVLTPDEFADLVGAYFFLRKLINAQRMLRGSAQDIFLPPPEAVEFVHLARRMGYNPAEGVPPAEQLARNFDRSTSAVRAFIERHFDRPCPGVERPAKARRQWHN